MFDSTICIPSCFLQPFFWSLTASFCRDSWIKIPCNCRDLARFLVCPFMAATDHTDCTDCTDRTDRTSEHGHNGHNLEVEFRATSSTRSLTWQVPESLVRGVPFRCLLAGGGQPFRTKSASAKVLAKHLKPCVTYDAFISHDWQTSGWLKLPLSCCSSTRKLPPL